MRYMIHACPDRMWYVDGLLVPSMIEQGIEPDAITVWNDTKGAGCLKSCVDAFDSCRNIPGGTWHLQDDVLISSEFAKVTKELAGDMIVCGFCYAGYEKTSPPIYGEVFPTLMWNSTFLCVYIPNRTAGEFVDWFRKTGMYAYEELSKTGKHDDTFFHEFCVHEKSNEIVLNYAPHLVEHVDYIIGGSVVNKWRGHPARGYYFDEESLVEQLTEEVVKLRFHREATTKKA